MEETIYVEVEEAGDDAPSERGAGFSLIDPNDWKWQDVIIDADNRTWYLARKEKPSEDGKKHWLYFFTLKRPGDDDRKVELPHGYKVAWMPYLVKES